VLNGWVPHSEAFDSQWVDERNHDLSSVDMKKPGFGVPILNLPRNDTGRRNSHTRACRH
jgi:hypothetical protein